MFKILTCAALAAVAITSSSLVPAVADPVSIVIIDQERVLRESLAGQDLAQQGSILRDQIQQEVTAEQNSILALQKTIEQNAKVYSPAQREQKIRELETRKQDYPAFEQKKSQILQASIGRAQNQIAVTLKPILQQLIDERKANIMLDRQVVMFAAPGLDASEEAIKRLNNVIRTVKVQRIDPDQPVARQPAAPGKPPIGIVKPN